jgi:hypothetical protein
LLTFPLIPAAITVAMLRHQLFDVRLVVSRAVLYLLLTGGVVAGYAALIAVLDRVLRGAGAPALATLLIALAFNPVRVRLQRLVDRAFYGVRADPVRAVTDVGQRMAGDDLGGVLDSIREALRVPFAALRSESGEIAASGQPPLTLQAVALTYRGASVGQLVVGVRRGEHRLAPADLAVLDLLATPLAVAVHATGLSEQVQASRERDGAGGRGGDRPGGGSRGGDPATRRGGDGPAHARAGRGRGHRGDRPGGAVRGGAGADHAGRRRVGVRRHARRRSRLPGQGRRAGGDRAGDQRGRVR